VKLKSSGVELNFVKTKEMQEADSHEQQIWKWLIEKMPNLNMTLDN